LTWASIRKTKWPANAPAISLSIGEGEHSISYYRDLAIRTYRNPGEPSNKRVRAHPLPGQGFSPLLNVECSARMRERHPVGTHFIIRAKITDALGSPFIYSYFGWPYRVVSQEEANEFIRQP
jgi:hypothetical protein